MRFLHLADLHIGRTVNSYSMVEDQRYALDEIVKLVKRENIKYVVIAGDIYQNTMPSAEAVNLLDDFITRLKDLDATILMISGNHDSVDRLSFASDILKNSKIYISKQYNGEIEKVEFEDEYGKINFYLFPYIKPRDVRKYFPEQEIISYSDAIRAVLDSIAINENERNIIISHQFILNAETSESEEIYAGEAEAVADIYYDKFDYVALGHIHKAQYFLDGKIRYPGALLKYAASESNYDKAIYVIDIKEKGNINYEKHRIKYLRDMRRIKGYFEDVLENSRTDENRDDYIHIELLDENNIPEAHQRLKMIYPNIMTFRYINQSVGDEILDIKEEYSDLKSPLQLFEDFYKQRLGKDISEEQRNLIEESINEIWGEK